MIERQKPSGASTDELESVIEDARTLAEKLGLDGYPVTYWLVDYEEMNQLIAYDGFPERYPHWRWGMKYERQRVVDQYGGGKAFEIVVNDDPAHAYLQESNSLADQKAVITHVEAHADFFKNNRWYRLFGDEVDAVAMLGRHGDRIESIMAKPDVDRDEVERYIDDVLSVADTIDQHRPYEPVDLREKTEESPSDDASPIEELDVSEEIKDAVFDREFLEELEPEEQVSEGGTDVLAFVRLHGKQYDEEAERAIEMEPWQKEVLDMLRREAYYFAPQRMTKVMNEGFAAYFESIMMGEEAFAGTNEFVRYADHQSRVLGSPGFNPYALGKRLWEYLENRANRGEVLEHLLRVDGIEPENFHDEIDFGYVLDLLEPTPPLNEIGEETLPELRDLDPSKVDQATLDRALSGDVDVDRYPWEVLEFEGLAERHYSLVKPQNRRFLQRISRADLEKIYRYCFDDDRYADVESAIDAVDRTVGWERIFGVRESHNDVTFIDEFLTTEFIREESYFTYEYSHTAEEYRVASTDPEDV
ncbi:MAG: SpoVR family protein, partial [Halodesulfurarchaeum sp.]